jgi:hypothetical protein
MNTIREYKNRFNQLMESTIGNVKPLVSEQEDTDSLEYLIKTNRLGPNATEVTEINLPDGEYQKKGSGNYIKIYDHNEKFTGYVIISKLMIRGSWNGEPIDIISKQPDGKDSNLTSKIFYDNVNYVPEENAPTFPGSTVKIVSCKVATEGIKNVTSEMVSSGPFDGFLNEKGIIGTFNGVKYFWDLRGVEGFDKWSNTQLEGKVYAEYASKMTLTGLNNGDVDPNGFVIAIKEFIDLVCFKTKSGTYKIEVIY